MNASDDISQRKALAERMSKLLGLPASQIELLIPLIPMEDLSKLESMADADFLRDSTRLINEAQRRQFQEMESGGGSAKGPTLQKPSAALQKPSMTLQKPGASRSQEPESASEETDTPKLRPLKKVGQPNTRTDPDALPPGFMMELGEAAGDSLTSEMLDTAEAPISDTVPAMTKAPASDKTDADDDDNEDEDEDDGIEAAEAKISSAFRRQDTTKKLDGKQKAIIGIAIGVGLIFLVLASFMGLKIFIGSSNSTDLDEGVANRSDAPSSSSQDPSTVATQDDPTDVEPAPDSTFMNDKGLWALDFSTSGEIAVPHPNLMADSVSFTAEMWVKLEQPDNVNALTISSTGSDQPFTFGIVRSGDTGLQLQFTVDIAGIPVGAIAPPPPVGTWVHVAGVYDPADGHRLAIFQNGVLTAEAPLPDVTPLHATGYTLSADLTEGNMVAGVGALRISCSARYIDTFTPPMLLTVDPNTTSLLPLEKINESMLADIAQQETEVEIAAGATWVKIDNTSMVEVSTAAPIAFPPALLKDLEAEQGKDVLNLFLMEWDKKSNPERIAYLEAIGYPVP